MKVGSMGTHLHLVCVEPGRSGVQSGTALACEAHAMAWTGSVPSLEGREVPEHGIHSEQWWQDDRAARVKMLRARVKSGSYKVDSMALAQCILENELRPL